ncbi:alpha/beta hydrolase family protein [Amycolatopsis sp.]|uniref:alpha/beta hydrolase n=1 Tax=Amycolatopsis sp. TaxID=37632 RepID=UPI002B61F66B|nr:alpha/beta hydrolase family protein [Amycolatopsis sp.]HVV12815.1 alpha/beta hydrolase family protein [Amycolatopsis sp.]
MKLIDEQVTDRLHELRLFSPALAREVSVTVLTPPGWQPGRRYPVLYLLHGSSDDNHCWTAHTEIVERTADSDVLVVMPDGGRIGFYHDWQVPDRKRTVPHWETFHLDELLPWVEERYGATNMRMAAGISMGGFGALRYAIRRPGLFRAVASLSGLVHLTRPGIGGLLALLSIREGVLPGRVWGSRRRNFANWAENDPYLHAAALRGTPVFLSAGDGNRQPGEETVPGMGRIERNSRAANEEFAERLRAEGVEVTTNFTGGTHFWDTWRGHLDALWPNVLATLSARNG